MKREELVDFLHKQTINKTLLKEVEDFVAEHPVDPAVADRVPESIYRYYGKGIWEKAIYAI